MKLFFLSLFILSAYAQAEEKGAIFKTFDGLKMNAKIYSPAELKEKKPAILILEGSGKSGFEQEPDRSPFRQLAQALSQQNYIVMNYNKRGSGENAKVGSFWKSDFSIDNKDAQAALKLLLAEKFVDKDRIFLVGHSFGGPQSLMLSQKNRIKGVVMLTSTIRPIAKLMHDQNKVILELQGKPKAEIQTELDGLDKQLKEIKSNSYKCLEPSCSLIEGVAVLDKSIQVRWLHDVLNLNFLHIAKSQPSPLLFIFGNSDFVIPVEDQKFVQELVTKKKIEKTISVKVIDKLDHFMVENESKKDSFTYAQTAQKEKVFKDISPALVETVVTWLSSIQ